jgi:hypothetical protein
MKSFKNKSSINEPPTWEEKSGLLTFLSGIPGEVEKFNDRFEFGINHIINLPGKIDNDPDPALKTGFVLTRYNPLLPEVTYCVYSVLENKVLNAYIGIYKGDDITPLKQLKPLKDFKKGQAVLYDWLSQLVRASYEKIMR